MKKCVSKLLAAVILLSMIFSFSACGKPLENAEIDRVLQDALAETAKADIFYWKETVVNGAESAYRQVNVYAVKDDDGNPIVDETGAYTDYKMQIIEKQNQKQTKQIFCGASADENGVKENILYTENFDADGKSTGVTISPMRTEVYFQSEAFRPYLPKTILRELEGLTAADMNFDIDDGEAHTDLYVTNLIFAPTEEYLTRYAETHTEKSLFDGAKKVLIEISYGRIASVIVYVDEAIEGSSLSVENERYKFQIVYLGPKFDMPVREDA